MPSKIFVKGARENNLKNIDVEIPRDALTVITGLSGSGNTKRISDLCVGFAKELGLKYRQEACNNLILSLIHI